MTTLTEKLHAGGFIVSESNGFRSRQQITIAVSQTLVTGQVISALAVTDGNIWKVLAPGSGDGTQLAAGILFEGVTTGAVTTDSIGVKQATALVRDCEVRAADLTWPAGITATQKALAITQLAALHIILR